MNKLDISIVVPTWNEEENIVPLTKRIAKALSARGISYEIIFIDDNSTDKTCEVVRSLASSYPISHYLKQGRQGKADSLLQGFTIAKSDIVCMLDADLQYPPEAIPDMLEKINRGADVVVANRKVQHTNIIRKVLSRGFFTVFGKFLHGFSCDVQSGLKVFRKEIVERVRLNPSPWTLDLELLLTARQGGYSIETVGIEFHERNAGKPKIGLVKASFEIGQHAIKLKLRNPQIIPFHKTVIKEKGPGFHYNGRAYVPYNKLDHSESALYTLTTTQKIILVGVIGIFALSLLFSWHTTVVVVIAALTMMYFSDLLFNFFLMYRSFSINPEIHISKREIGKLKDTDLPIYTVFCPLYKEWAVLPQFVTAIDRMDYPKDKLQVLLLLEEDDKETIDRAKAFNLPKNFEIVVVPDSKPKTKPKAMNYGLKYTKGEYVVIYDAEDVPEPTQLKKSILAFRKAADNVACIQAKLNFYNPHHNLLTRIFTAEYSLWFDLILPGLQSINAPIPLGGTSNHFNVEVLRGLHGWDSFNVTEDCDLGMRLVKAGFRTAIVESTTFEEANSDYVNWFWQRTRWIKGYVQSYLVHMRRPQEFISSWKDPNLIIFQLNVGGKFLSMLINPLMWIITISYFAFRATLGPVIESFFPAVVLYMGVTCLVFGNFMYLYSYMVGCAKRGYLDLIKFAYIIPIYWIAMSVAAWVALYKLIRQPHFWSKTKHGLHLSNQKALDQSADTIGQELVNTHITDMKPVAVFAKKVTI